MLNLSCLELNCILQPAKVAHLVVSRDGSAGHAARCRGQRAAATADKTQYATASVTRHACQSIKSLDFRSFKIMRPVTDN